MLLIIYLIRFTEQSFNNDLEHFEHVLQTPYAVCSASSLTLSIQLTMSSASIAYKCTGGASGTPVTCSCVYKCTGPANGIKGTSNSVYKCTGPASGAPGINS